jgi:hypothetical protein
MCDQFVGLLLSSNNVLPINLTPCTLVFFVCSMPFVPRLAPLGLPGLILVEQVLVCLLPERESYPTDVVTIVRSHRDVTVIIQGNREEEVGVQVPVTTIFALPALFPTMIIILTWGTCAEIADLGPLHLSPIITPTTARSLRIPRDMSTMFNGLVTNKKQLILFS